MPIPIISELFRTHPYISFLTGVGLLAVVGYFEIRAFPTELGAYWTLAVGLIILVFALAHATPLGGLGLPLAGIVLVAGIILLARLYVTHQKSGK